MSAAIGLLDVIQLTEDLPERGLCCGQLGTIVETLAPGVYEVEFIDESGRTQATLALRADQFMLHGEAEQQPGTNPL